MRDDAPDFWQHKKYYNILLLLILFIASIYRIYGLDRLSLWSDELWGVIACSKGSWLAMIQDLVFNDNHPPGYQTILYYTMKLFGDSEFVIRSPSAIAGIVSVYVVYQFGKNVFSKDVGILAALLVAGSYQEVYYSQEARAYTMLSLFCMLNSYYFLQAFVYQQFSEKHVLCFAATGAVCAYLHYAGVLFLFCEAIIFFGIFLLKKNKKSIAIAGLYGFGIILMVYARWIPVMVGHMTGRADYWAVAPTINTVYETAIFLLGPDSRYAIVQLALFVMALCLLARNLLKNKKLDLQQQSILILLILIALPIIVFFIKSTISLSVYTHRHFIFVIPLASLVSAYIIVDLIKKTSNRKKFHKVLLVSVLLLVASLQFIFNKSLYSGSYKQDYRKAVQVIADDRSQKVLVVTSHEFFDYYLRRFHVADHADYYLLFEEQFVGVKRGIDMSDADIFYYLEVSGNVETPISLRLDVEYSRIGYLRVNGINVIKYQKRHRASKGLVAESIKDRVRDNV